MSPDDADKQIAANMRAIENARRVRKEIRETLRDSRQQAERARVILRRAGYLR